MSAVVYLFLAHLGVGIAFTLLVVSKQAGVKFFRFNAGLAAALLAAALAFRPEGAAPGAAIVNRVTVAGLGVSLASLTIYWLIAGRVFGWLRPILAAIASAAGVVAVLGHGFAAASGGASWAVLTAVSALTSAALLGSACTAMVLGHWYLVIPSMEVRHLRRAVAFHLVTLAARILVVAVVLALAWDTPIGMGRSLRGYVTSLDGIFFWQRALFGLAAPLVLGYLTWETAKIRSTQSATGILYVDVFTVVVGEVLAYYVLLSTGLAV